MRFPAADLAEAKRRHLRAEHLSDAAQVAFGIGKLDLARELTSLVEPVMNGTIEWDVEIYIDAQNKFFGSAE